MSQQFTRKSILKHLRIRNTITEVVGPVHAPSGEVTAWVGNRLVLPRQHTYRLTSTLIHQPNEITIKPFVFGGIHCLDPKHFAEAKVNPWSICIFECRWVCT